MKRLLHISFIVFILLFCGATLRAQRIISTGRYMPYAMVDYFDSVQRSPDYVITVMASSIAVNGQEVITAIGSSASRLAWKDELNYSRYSGQVNQVRHRDNEIFLFGDEFPYYDRIALTGQSGTFILDSAKNADRIIDMFLPIKDTTDAYALIENNQHIYISKKKEKNDWEIVPIVIEEKNHRSWLRNSILWVAEILLFAAVFTFVAFRSKAKQVRRIQEGGHVVQDLKLRADRPLDKNQLADGDMKQAITAIADVIANRNTPLPMTIAINGAWGSGKSSIMNCIRQMLEENKDKRFITTWFNAWHQQSESSLLNAFLLKVIRRCEQPFFSKNILDSFFASFKFRTRLATTRFVKQPVYRKMLTGFTIVLFTIVLLDLCISLYYRSHVWRSADLHILGHTIDWKNLFSVTDITKSVITVVLPVISFLFLKSEKSPTLGAFASIVYKKNFTLESERNAPDMREKFRSEYWEIMGALGDKTLVVFIDDLDRVGGKKIFEMLEALNFISDVTSKPDDTQQESFRAVFILGMYVDQVAENLGNYLIESKEAIVAANNEPAKLGLQYLEKMIQLNVPVPLSANDILEPIDTPKNAS